ncbi:MAG: S9 family peptidase [Phycisphaerae bacterium]|nr:S9 family peptidase [Phycisphaerae bacterium]
MSSLALGNQVKAPDATPLIPRETLFGNPERAGLQISPDGSTISYLAPHEDVLNVWIQPTAGGEASVITSSTDRPIMGYAWAINGEQILYTLDKDGDENTHVYAVDLETKETTDLTPFDGVKAGMAGQHRDRPDEILVQMNQRDPRNMDMYKVNTRTGESELIFANDDGYVGMIPDDDWTVRGRAKMTEDGGTLFELRNSADGEWYEFMKVSMQDAMNTMPMGFSKDGTIIYGKDATGRDTSALVSMPARKGGAEQATVIFESDKADVGGVYSDKDTHEPRAVSVNYLRNEWHVLDPELQVHIDAIKALDEGDPNITDSTLDESMMVVAFERDNGPVNYWLYDTDSRTGRYLFSNRPDLEKYELVTTRPVEITARDGLVLPSYVTTPRGEGPWPTVVLVHGGPWARDSWGYNPIHQWLANRGYAVISPNFRGSTGFGKNFLNAGNRQWYHAMQDDVNDAAAWAVAEGIADKDRLAIMGGSYGGYATLAGMTRDPELWACGVDIVGPSHIGTLLSTIPMYWEPVKIMFTERVGGVDETEWLDSISPLTHVDNISKPLLIGQGANDPRVKLAESDQIVAAMNERSIPVTYVVFPDEGHGFAKPENRLAFMAVTEQFLSEHLGGRAEAVGVDVQDSTAQVRDLGNLQVEGVALWDASEAPADVPEAAPAGTVTFADLTPEQQAQVQQFLDRVDTIPLDQLGMMKSLLEAQRSNVPPAELPIFEFMLQTINEKIAEES